MDGRGQSRDALVRVERSLMDSHELSAFIAYKKRMTDEGLWWSDDLYDRISADSEYHLRRFRIQGEVESEFAPLPLMFLDRAETAWLAAELCDDLVEEYGGTHALTYRQIVHKMWSRPNHDRDSPSVVLPLLLNGCVAVPEDAEVLTSVWRSVEYPEQNGGRELWIQAFREVGWLSDADDGEDPPTEPFVVFRGAMERYSRGMAWTDKQDTATWFASRANNAQVWMTLATPSMVLAHFTGRGENEWVLDVPPDTAILPTG